MIMITLTIIIITKVLKNVDIINASQINTNRIRVDKSSVVQIVGPH